MLLLARKSTVKAHTACTRTFRSETQLHPLSLDPWNSGVLALFSPRMWSRRLTYQLDKAGSGLKCLICQDPESIVSRLSSNKHLARTARGHLETVLYITNLHAAPRSKAQARETRSQTHGQSWELVVFGRLRNGISLEVGTSCFFVLTGNLVHIRLTLMTSTRVLGGFGPPRHADNPREF